MSNGIKMLSYADMAQRAGAEADGYLRVQNDLNFLLFGFVLAVLIVLYKGIEHFLKRA